MRHKLSMIVISSLGLLERGLATIVLLGMLATQAVAAEKETFKINISSAVQEQIQKVSPDERRRLEAAISAGNKFIPYHYDGRAYDVGDSGIKEEWKFWLKNVRPLINKDVREWHTPYQFDGGAYDTKLFPPLTRDLTIEGHPVWPAGNTVSVCPKIDLISIAATDDHFSGRWRYPKSFAEDSFVLEYRAKIIGALMDAKETESRFFLPSTNDAFETVLISLGKDNKISWVATQNARWTWTVERQVGFLKLFISGALSDGVTANDKAQLKQTIQQIKSQKTKVCKDVSPLSNQPTTKE